MNMMSKNFHRDDQMNKLSTLYPAHIAELQIRAKECA